MVFTDRLKEFVSAVREHKRSLMVFALFALLAAAMWYKGKIAAGAFDGTVTRQGETGSQVSKSYFFSLEPADDAESSAGVAEEIGEQELEITVSPVEPDKEEACRLIDEAVSFWEDTYLGENTSVNEVRRDLDLPDEMCDGLVSVSYTSSDGNVLGTDGTVTVPDEEPEGVMVELTAEFSCGDYSRIETETLLILPEEAGTAEWLIKSVRDEVTGAEEESRQESGFTLPETVAGYRVIWSEGSDNSWVYFLCLGAMAVFCLEWRGRQQDRDYRKKREARLEFEYPQMVDQLSVLMESGMTIRRAWERILVRGYSGTDGRNQRKKKPEEKVYLEEMRITWREIQDGRGEREAYERFGNRIGLIPYRRFASILTQNLSKGTGDLKSLLQKESEEALEMRKTRARKMGEEAGAKMLFPMLVMLVLILLILLMPALSSFC